MVTQNETWHTENLTKQRSLTIITRSESKRKTYKGEKWSVKTWRSLTFPWTQMFVSLSLCTKIILLGFKRHKITGREIIVHKRTLDRCGHDQNTWLKKMKAFNSQLRPLETACWVQTQHGIEKTNKKGGEANVRKIIIVLKHRSSVDMDSPPPKQFSKW